MESIVKKIEHDYLFLIKRQEAFYADGLIDKWRDLLLEEPKRFIRPDGTIKEYELRNFRRSLIFIRDEPSFRPGLWNIKNILGGGRRGSRRLLLDCLNVLKQNNYDGLLKQHPCSPAGNPFVFEYRAYRFTYRWAKHIYSLGLFKDLLGKKIRQDFTGLSIGSSYGIFSYLLKREFRRCHLALLDFPEQLILAYYFLSHSFPEAKIAGFMDVLNAEKIDRAFLESYDFILIPWFLYEKMPAYSIDLVSNLASFGEMTRQWFDFYIQRPVFKTASYFFTENRFVSMPTYDTDLTILDYPLREFKTLRFGVCPMFSHTYTRKGLFFYEKDIFSSQYFEFVGERA